jgi:hypothetical protein
MGQDENQTLKLCVCVWPGHGRIPHSIPCQVWGKVTVLEASTRSRMRRTTASINPELRYLVCALSQASTSRGGANESTR